MSTDTVDALHIMIDSWNRLMLTVTPMNPTPASTRISRPVSRTCRRFICFTANGKSTSPPMRNRRKVSWNGSRSSAAILHATSMVPNSNAVIRTYMYARFIKMDLLLLLLRQKWR